MEKTTTFHLTGFFVEMCNRNIDKILFEVADRHLRVFVRWRLTNNLPQRPLGTNCFLVTCHRWGNT